MYRCNQQKAFGEEKKIMDLIQDFKVSPGFNWCDGYIERGRERRERK